MFDEWQRVPTNTEVLVSLIIAEGVDIPPPKEHASVYRIQPKITGVERRWALTFLGKRSGCIDVRPRIKGLVMGGIDILAPVSELVSKGIEIEKTENDHWLWVGLKVSDA